MPLRFSHRRQHQPDQGAAEQKRHAGHQIHRFEAESHHQRERQRRTDDPGQRNLRAQHRTEHDRFTAGIIRMFACQGEKLRVGGGAKAGQQHAQAQQQIIVAIVSEQHATQRAQQAAIKNQHLAIAMFVGMGGKELADENTDYGAAGIKQADHTRTGLDFLR